MNGTKKESADGGKPPPPSFFPALDEPDRGENDEELTLCRDSNKSLFVAEGGEFSWPDKRAIMCVHAFEKRFKMVDYEPPYILTSLFTLNISRG